MKNGDCGGDFVFALGVLAGSWGPGLSQILGTLEGPGCQKTVLLEKLIKESFVRGQQKEFMPISRRRQTEGPVGTYAPISREFSTKACPHEGKVEPGQLANA
jgi:hypothetical protein